MGWGDSGINWLNPQPNIPIWLAVTEIAKAINERHFVHNNQSTHVKQYPLIALTEDDNNPGSNNSRGSRQYKMYESYQSQYKGFNSMSDFGLMLGIQRALSNELIWWYSRTDLANYIVDDANPRTRTEMTSFGGPQAWDNAHPNGVTAVEFVESLYPLANNIITRLDTNDSSLYESNGQPKRQILTELFEIMKAFKFMNFNYQKDFFGNNTTVSNKRQLFGQPPETFNAVWAVTPDVPGFQTPSIQVFNQVPNVIGVCVNARLNCNFNDLGFTIAPDFVTPPRVRRLKPSSSLYDDIPVESLPEGFFDMPFTVSGLNIEIENFVTASGVTPNFLTIPPATDNWRSQNFGVASGGSSVSQNGHVFDLTTSLDLDFNVDGSP